MMSFLYHLFIDNHDKIVIIKKISQGIFRGKSIGSMECGIKALRFILRF